VRMENSRVEDLAERWMEGWGWGDGCGYRKGGKGGEMFMGIGGDWMGGRGGIRSLCRGGGGQCHCVMLDEWSSAGLDL